MIGEPRRWRRTLTRKAGTGRAQTWPGGWQKTLLRGARLLQNLLIAALSWRCWRPPQRHANPPGAYGTPRPSFPTAPIAEGPPTGIASASSIRIVLGRPQRDRVQGQDRPAGGGGRFRRVRECHKAAGVAGAQ